MIGRQISHYRVVSKLGAGGMGVVYKAEDLRLKRYVTLKFLTEKYQLNPQALERFRLETKVIAALSHPNICTIHDMDREGDLPFIVMEFIEGKTLRETMQSTSALEPEQLLALAMEIAEGLQEAHSKGIVHRDIKPSNIMVTHAGHAKILDFGLAKLTEASPSYLVESEGLTVDPITHDGAMVGTVTYMSPEQALGRPIDGRSDLFSLGVILYEMATGEPPFKGVTQAAFINELLHHKPISPLQLNPFLPPGFEPLLERALQKQPEFRYQTAGDFRSDMANVRHQITISKSPLPAVDTRAPRFTLARAVRIIGLIVLAFLVILGLQSEPGRDLVRWFIGEELPVNRQMAILDFSPLEAVNEEDSAFCLGLTEEFATALAHLEGHRSDFTLLPLQELRRAKISSAREAHLAFGVPLALYVTVDLTDEEIVLHMELLDAGKLATIDRETVTNPKQERGRIVEMVVRAFSRMIDVSLTEQDNSFLLATRAQGSEAIELYFRGLSLLDTSYDHKTLQEAISVLQESVQKDPDYLPSTTALARAHIRLFNDTRQIESLKRAEELCLEAQASWPDSPEVLSLLGQVYHIRGMDPEAEGLLRRSLALSPFSLEAAKPLAEVLQNTGRPDEAESLLRQTIERYPEDWVGYLELANLYYEQGRFSDALQIYTQVVRLNPKSSRSYANLGAMHLSNGNLSEASAMLRLSIQMNPTDYAYSNLAYAFYFQENIKEAAEMVEKALEIDDTDYTLWLNLGGFYKQLGDETRSRSRYEEAIRKLTVLVDLNPTNAEYRIDLADCMINSGDKDGGLKLLDGLGTELQDNRMVEKMNIVGQIYEDAGQRAKAIEWVIESLRYGYPIERVETSTSLAQLIKDPAFERALKTLKSPSG